MQGEEIKNSSSICIDLQCISLIYIWFITCSLVSFVQESDQSKWFLGKFPRISKK